MPYGTIVDGNRPFGNTLRTHYDQNHWYSSTVYFIHHVQANTVPQQINSLQEIRDAASHQVTRTPSGQPQSWTPETHTTCGRVFRPSPTLKYKLIPTSQIH